MFIETHHRYRQRLDHEVTRLFWGEDEELQVSGNPFCLLQLALNSEHIC